MAKGVGGNIHKARWWIRHWQFLRHEKRKITRYNTALIRVRTWAFALGNNDERKKSTTVTGKKLVEKGSISLQRRSDMTIKCEV